MSSKPLSQFMTVRLKPSDHKAFRAKASRYGGVSEVLRELVVAFLEDRMTITPPSNPRKENLYVTRIQD
jgi:hypothetical protein